MTLAPVARGWLVVFDNAINRAPVERFMPPPGPGRVLITSQNPHGSPGQALDVPVLDFEVAADFLATRTGDTDQAADFLATRTGDTDQAAARELAAGWAGCRLALEQAAA